MTRRTVRVPLDLATIAEAIGLHESQRILTTYVEGDPHRVIVVVEGGAELPAREWAPDDDWRYHGFDSPWAKAGEIPQPE